MKILGIYWIKFILLWGLFLLTLYSVKKTIEQSPKIDEAEKTIDDYGETNE